MAGPSSEATAGLDPFHEGALVYKRRLPATCGRACWGVAKW